MFQVLDRMKKSTLKKKNLPDAVPKGYYGAVKVTANVVPTLISFDLVTTDLSKANL